MRLAGIELGGTKAIAVLGDQHGVARRTTIPTLSPGETLAALNRTLREWHDEEPLNGLGIASFGPVRVDPGQADYGQILATPKPGWSGADVIGPLSAGLTCPVTFDTDVNAAALAEHLWGGGQGCEVTCYITIGTGVGGGLVIAGQPVHGAMHPEIGHLALRRAPGDGFAGTCPFHRDCIEGLISGSALKVRFGDDPAAMPDDHTLWDHVVHDLVELCAALLLNTSADRILFGGSVSLGRTFLFPRVRAELQRRLANFLPFLNDHIEQRVALATLGTEAGPRGALALALRAAQGIAESERNER